MYIENRNDIGKLLNFYNLNKKGVEIGTFNGSYAKTILETWGGTLYMIDPWREDLEGYSASDKNNFDVSYQNTINNIKGYEDRAFMLRGMSNQMVNLFDNESLDFIYIDGNHEYDYVKEDLKLWFPKVKKGGLVAGHDYLLFNNNRFGWYEDKIFSEDGVNKHIWDNNHYCGLFGVNPAVDEFCNENKYVLNHTKEWFSTWYFIK